MKRNYLKRIIQVFIIAVLCIVSMSLLVMADDCNHEWSIIYSNREQYSADEHKVINGYGCVNCDERKEELFYEKHNWEEVILNAEYSTNTLHEVTKCYYCNCGEKKYVKEKENHIFNKYNHCTECATVVPQKITLKPNEKAYINNQTLAKVKVTKKGYLRVYVYNNDANWGLYDRYKLPYNDAQWMKSKMCVPVKKGTYYLKVNNDSCVKYTFTKKSTKNNSKRLAAINLKKNKGVVTLVYPPAKKNTWTGYYKIKIPKKQLLHLLIGQGSTTPGVGAHGELEINIYDSKGKLVPWEGSFGTEGNLNGITLYNKLKKGTYYIKLKKNYYSDATKEGCVGTVISLKWVTRRIQ